MQSGGALALCIYWTSITLSFIYGCCGAHAEGLCDLKSVKCKILHYGYNMTIGSTKLDSKSRNTKLSLVYKVGTLSLECGDL